MLSGCADSLSAKIIISKLWSWSAVTCIDVKPGVLQREVLHCQLNTGCPVAPLNMLQVDVQLGLISVGEVEASFVRALVAFNDVLAMRVKRQICGLLAVCSSRCRRAAPDKAAERWARFGCQLDAGAAQAKRPTRVKQKSGACCGTSRCMRTASQKQRYF